MALPSVTPSIRETRRTQVFPLLEAAEIDRIRHFGEARVYGTGDMLARVGEVSRGFMIVTSGRIPIIEGYDPSEGWGWCYVDEIMFDLSDRMTPHNGPIPRYY